MKKCKVDSCTNEYYAKGFCEKHYAQKRRLGYVKKTQQDKTPNERFYEKFEKGNDGDCWEWKGPKDKDGYGVTYSHGKNYKAHRHSFILANGPIDEGMQVCHHCDNTSCVNPNHLFLGTSKDNHKDMDLKGRRRPVYGSKSPWAKLNEFKVIQIKQMLKKGFLQKDIAEKFDISQRVISGIKTGRVWKHVT